MSYQTDDISEKGNTTTIRLQSPSSICGSSNHFRMVGPNQLGNLVNSQLPVLTLSAIGLVSLFNTYDQKCGDRQFTTLNALEKLITSSNPSVGQYLMQKLEPIIAHRRQEKTFSVDAWSDSEVSNVDFGVPDELLVICLDTSYSMSLPMHDGWIDSRDGEPPSRLTEVKEFSKNTADRVSGMGLNTYLGLLTFSHRLQIEVKQDLTPVHLNFEDQIEDVETESNCYVRCH